MGRLSAQQGIFASTTRCIMCKVPQIRVLTLRKSFVTVPSWGGSSTERPGFHNKERASCAGKSSLPV